MCVNLVVLRKLYQKLRCFPRKFSWHKFYMTAGRDGRDKSQLWIYDIHTWHIMYIINAKSLAYDLLRYTECVITQSSLHHRWNCTESHLRSISYRPRGCQKKSSTIFQEFTFIQWSFFQHRIQVIINRKSSEEESSKRLIEQSMQASETWFPILAKKCECRISEKAQIRS